MKKIMLVGGSGIIGKYIAKELEFAGYQISLLSRNQTASINYSTNIWNPLRGEIPVQAIEAQDIIINLGGANIAGGRWTIKRKKDILTSRIVSTRLLINTILENRLRPELFINASAIGLYGHRPGEQLTEESERGDGFLSQVCSEWERELLPLVKSNIPTAILRFGMVLSNSGGILPKLLLPLQHGLNIRFGDGQQFFSWIHIDDLSKCIQAMITGQLSPGTYNCTAPAPIRQVEFNKLVQFISGKNMLRINLPQKLLSLLLGEFSSLLTDDAYVIPKHLLNQKFEFVYPTLVLALQDLLPSRK